MMKIVLPFIAAWVMISGCAQRSPNSTAKIKTADIAWLDSVVKNSDSSYVKPYKRDDFVTATSYVNKKDSSVCQVMKDSAGTIRQIIIARKDIRVFFAQYFTNGQLMAQLPLDQFGQYHGTSTYYYKNGSIQTTGDYIHGIKTADWENFDEHGKLLSSETYDQNGQLISTAKK